MLASCPIGSAGEWEYRPSEAAYVKWGNRAEFPLELETAGGPYTLRAVVMHIGSIEAGHYTTVVRHGEGWALCDDETVASFQERDLAEYAFGDGSPGGAMAYLLMYEQAREGMSVIQLDPRLDEEINSSTQTIAMLMAIVCLSREA
jgi:hypothetical protein